jgi:hypothetical protein
MRSQTRQFAHFGGSAEGNTDISLHRGNRRCFHFADTIHVLRWIRGHHTEAWKQYGYVDAFNPLTGWNAADVIGIDLGVLLLMAENQRTQFV